MSRHELTQGHITVAYGYLPHLGTFLHVIDNRLTPPPSSSSLLESTSEINAVRKRLTDERGGGYLFLHTGYVRGGAGVTVSLETLLEFWREYGVPHEYIDIARRERRLGPVAQPRL